MSEMELYSLWCENAKEDPDLQAELAEVKGNNDAIVDRFYRDLEFGTGGLRGVIGAGTNRMNIYTVRRATQGFADYLNQEYKNPSVAISYDSRIKSDVFSKAAAEVLAANGIKVHIYTELMPTPCLSWAVRALKCQGGIMVTASHNPAKYNGYKVYGEDGCQITLRGAEIILEKINSLDIFNDVKSSDFEAELAKGNISYIGNDVIEDFYKHVLAEGINTDLCASSGLKVVYTPLNGTGNKPVREILKRIGITDVTVVKEQENPDGTFSTCPYPNPEIREALQVGLSYCDKVKPDLLLATDPDCDRVGIAVPDGKGGYALFSGNEVGAMLLEYICQQRIRKGTMPANPIAVKTIVTTDIVNLIGKEYGVEVIDVLTGFKFIGEQIGFLEAKGEEKRYIFGFEESYGYLSGGYVRDKDAVDASMLICEMAAYYRTQGITLIQARENMYKKYGMFLQTLYSFEFEGASGMKHMEEIMTGLRNDHPTTIGGLKVERFEDYKASTSKNIATGEVKELTLPKSNVLAFYLEGGCKAIVRPSGTEPKIKTYITAKAPTRAEAEVIEQKIYADFTQSMK
ncbi:phosphoglucomutase [Ruminococcus flavefaciens]|uniref:Phosphoglucomutase n=1 Tax=Ruminococcus flavefaciens TaxID=1265 RepID=A0A1H6HZR9_RUMFL|nr:phospho-sugar mutase [Ruminococcus flavefaciens]SEH39705.1 phosphoglucomutase [Ruminococcus flavefaciens]